MRAPEVARWVGGAALSSVALLSIAAGSAAPIGYHDSDAGRLRLSWSGRPERIETCRTVSEAELEEREEHMRQRVECDGTFATYALEVRVDERRLTAAVVRGAGLRHDRPMYLLRDFDIPAGTRRVQVSLLRRERATPEVPSALPSVVPTQGAADTGLFAGRAEREVVERGRRGLAALPPRLTLDTTLTVGARGVTIVTLSQERRALEVVREDSERRRPESNR